MSSKTLKGLSFPLLVLILGVAGRGSDHLRPQGAADGSSVRLSARWSRSCRSQITDVPVVVNGHGEVVARVAVDVVPQVAGQVVKIHPSLVAGGFFSAGEVLVVIDPRDYELAVERGQAAVARAKVSLEREQAEAVVAREEWDELHPG